MAVQVTTVNIVQSTCQATYGHIYNQDASCIATPHTVVLHRKPQCVEPSANSFRSQNSKKKKKHTLDYSTTVCLSVCNIKNVQYLNLEGLLFLHEYFT